MHSESLFSARFTKTYAAMPGGNADLNLVTEGKNAYGPAGAQKCRRITFKDAGTVHVSYGPNQDGTVAEVLDTFVVIAGQVVDRQIAVLKGDTTTVTNFTVEW